MHPILFRSQVVSSIPILVKTCSLTVVILVNTFTVCNLRSLLCALSRWLDVASDRFRDDKFWEEEDPLKSIILDLHRNQEQFVIAFVPTNGLRRWTSQILNPLLSPLLPSSPHLQVSHLKSPFVRSFCFCPSRFCPSLFFCIVFCLFHLRIRSQWRLRSSERKVPPSRKVLSSTRPDGILRKSVLRTCRAICLIPIVDLHERNSSI